ncbi:LacI family DNA-binding transcriptional regulator [Paracoccus sp. KR1-242]|uniref:LacI family DNA-binding transcriptional regulator n=1 Tax=Paracoccus sp. KR1-242 TaxID=3410028 RepID=UPI003BFE3565
MENQLSKPDIVFVAKLAGVSAATVSRVINHPDQVRPGTRRKVELAIEKSGYIRNRAASAMHGKRSATIGVIIPTLANTIFAEVIQAFNETVSAQGYTLLLASHGYDLEVEYKLARKLLEHRVDALVLVGFDHHSGVFRLIGEQPVPCLAIWNHAVDAAMPCIGVDNREAGRIAAEHLIALGHQDVALIFPETIENDRARDRMMAALDAFRASGAEIGTRRQIRVPYSVAQAKSACISILNRPDRPSALLCCNDVIAQGAVYAAARLGIRVPAELSIIGIGDFVGSAQMEPALTSVRIPAQSIGISAGQEILRVIETGEHAAIRSSRIDLELVMRGSTGISRQLRQG